MADRRAATKQPIQLDPAIHELISLRGLRSALRTGATHPLPYEPEGVVAPGPVGDPSYGSGLKVTAGRSTRGDQGRARFVLDEVASIAPHPGLRRGARAPPHGRRHARAKPLRLGAGRRPGDLARGLGARRPQGGARADGRSGRRSASRPASGPCTSSSWATAALRPRPRSGLAPAPPRLLARRPSPRRPRLLPPVVGRLGLLRACCGRSTARRSTAWPSSAPYRVAFSACLPLGADESYFGSIFAAKVCVAILPSRTT
jgi:hypothetical protein